MAKCKKPDPINDAALNKIGEVLSNIESSYDQTFGSPLIEVHGPAIKKVLDNIADVQLDINISKGANKVKLKNKKRGLQKQLSSLQVEDKEGRRKLEFLVKIRKLMTETLKDYADENLYSINPNVYFPVIREMLWNDLGRPFMSLDQLYLGDLRAIYGKLNRLYRKQGSAAKLSKIPKLRHQHQDPATIALRHDPSLRAYNLVQKSRAVPSEIFARVNRWDNSMRNARTPFEDSVKTDQFLFRVSVPEGLSVTTENIEESLKNATKFAADILDGNVRYIIPKPIGFVKKKDPRYKELSPYQKDRKKYEEKVREDVLSGINAGKNIQQRVIGNQTFYYVPILQPAEEHGGKEVWYAYQVPHKPPKKGQKSDFLFLPRSKGKKAIDEVRRREFDALLGNLAPLATHTKEDGRVIQGRMEEGWYSATTHPALSGKKSITKGGQTIEKEFLVGSYSDFLPVKNINPSNNVLHDNETPPGFWPMIADIRNILESYYHDLGERIQTHESRMGALIAQANKIGQSSNSSDRMNRAEFTEMIQQITQLDNIRGGLSFKDGQIFTSNTIFSAQETFFPRRWDPNGTVTGMVKGMQNMKGVIQKTLDDIAGKMADQEATGADHMEALTNLNTKVEDMANSLEVLEENLALYLGEKDITNARNFSMDRAVAAAQHRSAFMPPLPGRTDPGRRGDFDVFHDYFYESERGISINELAYDLLNVGLHSSKSVTSFALNEVKATMGSQDIESGMLGINYNDIAFTKFMNATVLRYRGADNQLTPESLRQTVRAISMFISGNLLQIGSVFNNHWQKLSPWAHSTAEEYLETGRLQKMTIPPGMKGEGRMYADVIAEESGATDVVTALADALLGSMTSELTGTDGFWTKKDLVVFSLPLIPFKEKVRNSEIWKKHFLAALKRRTDVTEVTGDQLMNIYEGTWLLINGIKEGEISPSRLKKITKLYKGILSAEAINNYASWGLGGAYISGHIQNIGPWDLRKVLTFSGVEESMRTWTACLGCVMAVRMGLVPKEWLQEVDSQGRRVNNPYLHPMAIKFARILNNITMFGLSDQFLNTMMRGSVGKGIWKFKGYNYQQMIREHKVGMHMWDSMSEADLMEKIKETLMLLPPALPGTTVANEAFAELTIPGIKRGGKKRQSYVHEAFRKMIWSRGLMALAAVNFFYMPYITEGFKFLKNRMRSHALGPGARAVERGGTSAIGEVVLRALYLIVATGGLIPADEDDEDRVYEDLRRYLLPMMVNMGIDLWNGEPGKVLRVFSQTPYRILDAVGLIDDDPE